MTTATATFRFREIAENLRGPTAVSIKDSALIVIDAQNFYLPDGMWPVHEIEKTNKVINALVERYREVSPLIPPSLGEVLTAYSQAGGEVIFVVHTGDTTSTRASIAGSPLDCIPGMEPRNGEKFIVKAQGSRYAPSRPLSSRGMTDMMRIALTERISTNTSRPKV
jgi:hypothetical protein